MFPSFVQARGQGVVAQSLGRVFELWVYHLRILNPWLFLSRDTGTVKGPRRNVAPRQERQAAIRSTQSCPVYLFWQGGRGGECQWFKMLNSLSHQVSIQMMGQYIQEGKEGTKPWEVQSSYFPAQGLPPPSPCHPRAPEKKIFFSPNFGLFLPSLISRSSQ